MKINSKLNFTGSHKPRISMKLFCNDGPRPGFFENSKPMFSSNVSQQDLIKVPSQSKVGHQSSNGTELIETVPDHSDTEGTIEMAAEQPEEIVAQPNVSPAHSIEMNEKDTTTSERSDSYEKVAESLFSQEFVPNPYNQSSDTEIVGTVNSNTDNNDSRHQKRLLSNIQQNEIEPNDQVELNHHKERSDSSASSDHNYSPISSPEIYFDETNDSFMCEPASQTNEVSPTIIGYLRIPLDHEFKMNIPRLKCILTHSGSSILSTQSAEPNETRFNQRKDIESNVDSSRVWKTFCLESSSDEDDTTVTNSLTFNEVTQDVHDVGEKLPEIEPGYHFFVSSDDSVISTMDFAMTLNQNSQCEAGSVNCDKIETKTNEELQPEVKDKEDDKIDVQPSTSAGNPRSPPLVQCFQLDESSDSEAADESEDSPKDADDDEFGGITLSLEDLEDIVDSDSSWPEIIDDENDDPVEALSKLVDLSQKHKRKMKERKKNPSKAAVKLLFQFLINELF